MKKNKISALKDKDLMADTGGITKTREYGDHKRPPRIEERDNFRERYLDKDEKKDITADIDLSVDENGQVYVDDKSGDKQVRKISDLVSVPEYVNPTFDVMIEDSMNKDNNYYEIPVNEENNDEFANFDSFSFSDDNLADEIEEASDDDIELADDEENNPFDDMFDNSEEENKSSDEPNDDDINSEQNSNSENEDEETNDSEETTNDGIDNYLNMEIDDSKLSEENKEKLDNFTSDQLDAFKKFLFENKMKKE